jgi:predicted RND superfamily exporter protein
MSSSLSHLTLHLDTMSAYAIIGVSLSFLTAIWIPATLLCCIPWIQKRKFATAHP